jgi:plastocyanin
MRRLLFLIVVGTGAVVLVPLGVGAGPTLTGVVGPAFTISLSGPNGAVTQLDPGPYTIQVQDLAPDHNFHLRGTGVNEATGLEEVENVTWEVTFANGLYTLVCDAHPVSMRKTFRVGAAPAVPKLYGTVGPGRTIKLGKKAGGKSATVTAGAYSIVVSDRSKTESFHLIGPGVNKKTGKAFKGTATWRVTLRKGGMYRYYSDARPTLAGVLRAT